VQRERTDRTEDEKDRTKRVAVTAQVTQKQKRCDVHTEPQTAKLNTQHKIVIYFNRKTHAQQNSFLMSINPYSSQSYFNVNEFEFHPSGYEIA